MLKVNGIEIKQDRFPDNSLLMKIDFESLNLEAPGVATIEWYYENDSELFALICLKRHFDQHFSFRFINLYLPYIPNARQDRVKTDEDVFTLKYFAEIINSLNFNRVIVQDAHSNVSLALLDRVVKVDIAGYINTAIQNSNPEVLFFPDEGAMKRYSGYANLPYAFGMKKRDWNTGKIEGLQVINSEIVKGKNVLIIDDICSRGGTFLHSAKALKELGAENICLYVSHAEDTMVDGEMYNTPGLVDHIYTTDTIFHKEKDTLDKVSIISI